MLLQVNSCLFVGSESLCIDMKSFSFPKTNKVENDSLERLPTTIVVQTIENVILRLVETRSVMMKIIDQTTREVNTRKENASASLTHQEFSELEKTYLYKYFSSKQKTDEFTELIEMVGYFMFVLFNIRLILILIFIFKNRFFMEKLAIMSWLKYVPTRKWLINRYSISCHCTTAVFNLCAIYFINEFLYFM